jgi:hypothetical protein
MVVLLLAGCGAVPPGTGDASGPRTASPSSVSPTSSPVPSAFLAGDCTYPASAGTQTQPAPDTFQTAVSVPLGWNLEDSSHSDSDFLMTAPATYLYPPTTISVSAPSPTDPGQSPSTFLGRIAQGTVSVTAAPQQCSVGNDPAAFLSFTNGANAGYMVLWFHFGDAYLLQVKGNGGVDQRAIQDAKGVLASVKYAHNVPPPGYSPTPAG